MRTPDQGPFSCSARPYPIEVLDAFDGGKVGWIKPPGFAATASLDLGDGEIVALVSWPPPWLRRGQRAMLAVVTAAEKRPSGGMRT